MLETITGLPAGVLGFEAKGELHADDYRNVLIPAVEWWREAAHRARVRAVR
jgi:hypothetical protein